MITCTCIKKQTQQYQSDFCANVCKDSLYTDSHQNIKLNQTGRDDDKSWNYYSNQDKLMYP
jgi:hypothetical protein